MREEDVWTPGGGAGSPARLLDLDPDLGAGLSPGQQAAARASLLVRVHHLPDRGRWTPPVPPGERGLLGLLVCDGVLLRSATHGRRRGAELLGEGDLLRPWDVDADMPVPFVVEWRVLSPVTFAELGAELTPRLAHHPTVLDALVERALHRSRWLMLLHVITTIPTVDERLRMLFWSLASRWGRVRSAGVWLPLHLSHADLAAMVGARRPSVTTALGMLERSGAIRREPDGVWLLDAGPVLEPRVDPD